MAYTKSPTCVRCQIGMHRSTDSMKSITDSPNDEFSKACNDHTERTNGHDSVALLSRRVRWKLTDTRRRTANVPSNGNAVFLCKMPMTRTTRNAGIFWRDTLEEIAMDNLRIVSSRTARHDHLLLFTNFDPGDVDIKPAKRATSLKVRYCSTRV